MRVLWFSVTPSNYDTKIFGGWISSLENIVHKYCKEIVLGIAFEHNDDTFKKEKNGTTYYPIKIFKNKLDNLKWRINPDYEWRLLRTRLINIVNDFQPDIIQCFGSEWPFGLIAREVKIPVVIHMQGFSNIYRLSNQMALTLPEQYYLAKYNPIKILQQKFKEHKSIKTANTEKEIMHINKFFMGRTEWDKNIVKYYSPNSFYFHCEEAIRPEIKNSYIHWEYKETECMKIISISSASTLKGNSLILRTAKLLKDFNVNFEWRVAGHKDSFNKFEKLLNINHNDVNITMLGTINVNDVVRELINNEVYVHTAIIDNSPNSICEAQLIGIPVISTNVGGIPQLIEDGNTGLLYPYNEPHTLAFILMNIHNNKNLQEHLSQQEKDISYKRHDECSISNQLISIYKKIIEEYYK